MAQTEHQVMFHAIQQLGVHIMRVLVLMPFNPSGLNGDSFYQPCLLF